MAVCGADGEDVPTEPLDKHLDRIIRQVFRRRPRKGSAVVRPKESRRLFPVHIRGQRNDGAAPLTYVLPSWRKELKGQLPHDICETTKLDSVKGTRSTSSKNAKVALRAHPSSALIGSKPFLTRDGKSIPHSIAELDIVIADLGSL